MEILQNTAFATVKNLTKPNIKRELLQKTTVLNHSQKRYLKSGVELSHLTFASHLLRNDKVLKSINTPCVTVTLEPSKHRHTKIGTTALLVSLLATCQPSYAEVGKSLFGGNSDFVEQLNKISYLPSISEIFSLISNSDFLTELSKINQLPVFDSFNCIDTVAVNGNNKVLSQSISVTPQRHCGFFAPVIYLASQASLTDCASAAASHPRLQSVYDGTTRPNKPMANKSGGTNTPRVNPVTLISQVSVIQNSKVLGVVNHG